MLQGRRERLSGTSVPELGGVVYIQDVAGSRQDGPSIGAEGYGVDGVLILQVPSPPTPSHREKRENSKNAPG
jgi:hypothetical protein